MDLVEVDEVGAEALQAIVYLGRLTSTPRYIRDKLFPK